MIKVSVIIPFYNGIEWLCEAVESVLAQTLENIEIIVVNDGSAEDVTAFLARYGNRIRYLHQPNSGVAAARNKGMAAAAGDYIAFLDSDDIWMHEKLEAQVRFMERTGVMWSHTGFWYWYPADGRLKVIDNSRDYGDISRKIWYSTRIATPGVMFSRHMLDLHPEFIFPVEFRKGQDTQLYRRIAKHYPIGLVKRPLVKVRMRADNSYRQVFTRFRLNASDFVARRKDRDVPVCAKAIYSVYWLYSKLLGDKGCALKERVAMCLWALPYGLERVCARAAVLLRRDGGDYITD